MTIYYIGEVLQPNNYGDGPYSQYPLGVMNDHLQYQQYFPKEHDNYRRAEIIISDWNSRCRTHYRYRLHDPDQ